MPAFQFGPAEADSAVCCLALPFNLTDAMKTAPMLGQERRPDGKIRAGWQSLERRRSSHFLVGMRPEPPEMDQPVLALLDDQRKRIARNAYRNCPRTAVEGL